MSPPSNNDDFAKERPAWLFPALVAAGVVILSAFFLYYYFGPTPRELLGLDPQPSARTIEIEAIIGGTWFIIPENYTRYPVQRTGGIQREVAMHALLPDLEPFSEEQRAAFDNNAPDSAVLYFSLREAGVTLSSEQRFKRIYKKYLDGKPPEHDMLNMDRYAFSADSGYKDQDLFTYRDQNNQLALLLCDQLTSLIDSPNCTRTLLLSDKLALTYRYKRAHRANWQEIDAAILLLIQSFDATPVSNGDDLLEGLPDTTAE